MAIRNHLNRYVFMGLLSLNEVLVFIMKELVSYTFGVWLGLKGSLISLPLRQVRIDAWLTSFLLF